jgi:hypothetical protein
MASTYVNDLRLNEMATGDASGSWGTVTNTNLELIGEAFSYGTETIGDADSTLTIADGAADAARSFYLKITSSVDLTTTRIVTLAPNTVSKVWMIENATTGSQVITIKQGSGATINVPNGQVKMISTDGAGSGGAVLDLLVDVDLTGTTTLVNLDVSGTALVTGVLTTTAATVFNGGFTANADSTLGTDKKVQFRDAAIYINSSVDGQLDIVADTEIQIAATTIDVNGALDVSGTALVTGVLTTTAATVSNGGGQFNGAINVGVDDTGYDVKFFGATTGKSLLWDESADSLTVAGNLSVDGGTIKLDGNYPVGSGNVALGDTALDSNVSGNSNVAIGTNALTANTGSGNTAVGNAAGFNNTSGHIDAFGLNVLSSNTTGNYNSAFGQQNGYLAALQSNTTGSSNAAFATGALGNTTTGSSNTGIGVAALYANTASNNTAVGYQAAYANTTGIQVVALGTSALPANTTGNQNIGIGYRALFNNTTGYENVVIGAEALSVSTVSALNTVIGTYAGASGMGSENVVIGASAMRSALGGAANVAIGRQALYSSTASNNTAVGYQAAYTNTTGTTNVALGVQALYANTTGAGNVALGATALDANTTGASNVAVGQGSLGANTTANNNTAVGTSSLVANTTGTSNVALGTNALGANTTASNNTGLGFRALFVNTTGASNTAVGASALTANTTGLSNTAVGYTAGSALTTANQNTFIGVNSGKLITTGANNTIIGAYNGNQGSLDIRTSDNYIVLSDGDGNPRASWNGANASFGGTLALTGLSSSGAIATSAVGAAVTSFKSVCNEGDQTATNLILQSGRTDVYYHMQAFVSGTTEVFRIEASGDVKNTNNSYGALSDAKLKENIVDASPKLADLMQVKVRNYNLIGETTKQIGVVAQELETVFPLMVDENADRDEDGNLLETTTKGVKYSVFVPMLIKAIQEQQATITALTARITALES